MDLAPMTDDQINPDLQGLVSRIALFWYVAEHMMGGECSDDDIISMFRRGLVRVNGTIVKDLDAFACHGDAIEIFI